MLGTILQHIDANTTLIVLSDHGIKPLRERVPSFAHHDHGGTTPIIANHDFKDADDVLGVFIAMGHIRKGVRIMGLHMSVSNVAPTILHLYGLPPGRGSRGRVLTGIFEAHHRPE